jgi:hypothetical protein
MDRFGCARGYIRSGKTCKRINLPYLGRGRVPSIENIEGCKKVGGKWNHGYGVCVMADSCDRESCWGYTAPIKGAVASWNYLDFYEAEDRKDPDLKGVCAAHVNLDIAGGFQEHDFPYIDPIWEEDIGYYYNYVTCKELAELARDIGLSLAKLVKEGKAGEIHLGYFTPEGRPVSPFHKEAVVANYPHEVVESYKDISEKRPKPFSLRRRGRW